MLWRHVLFSFAYFFSLYTSFAKCSLKYSHFYCTVLRSSLKHIPNNRHAILLHSGRKEILKGLGIKKKNDYPAEAVRQTGIDTGMQNTQKDFQELKGQL